MHIISHPNIHSRVNLNGADSKLMFWLYINNYISRTTSLCVFARVPFVYGPSVNTYIYIHIYMYEKRYSRTSTYSRVSLNGADSKLKF